MTKLLCLNGPDKNLSGSRDIPFIECISPTLMRTGRCVRIPVVPIR